MRKLIKFYSHLQIGEMANVLTRISQETKNINIENDVNAKQKIDEFKSSVQEFNLLLQKKRSTVDYTANIRKIHRLNCTFLNLLAKTVELKIYSPDPQDVQAAKEILHCIEKKKNFYVGSSEYRYSVLQIILAAIGNLDPQVLEIANVSSIYERLVKGFNDYHKALDERTAFKATINKGEVIAASKKALEKFYALCEYINAFIVVCGNDDLVADFVDTTNEILSEINQKVKIRYSKSKESTESTEDTEGTEESTESTEGTEKNAECRGVPWRARNTETERKKHGGHRGNGKAQRCSKKNRKKHRKNRRK